MWCRSARSASERDRCPHCRRRCPGYDLGEGRRRWRALDSGTTFCFLEADAPRVDCKRHGVVVAAVPWARHDAGFTRSFEDQSAWLAVNTLQDGGLAADADRVADGRLDLRAGRRRGQAPAATCSRGSTRIGIDEISIRKGQRYLTVVVDHDTGRLVWARPAATARRSRSSWICWAKSAASRSSSSPATTPSGSPGPSPSAARTRSSALDPFHIVKAATDALDEIRRAVWNEARRSGNTQLAKKLKGARFALWKNPENLTDRQQAKLAWIQKLNAPIYRAYLLKEQLRQIYHAARRGRTRAARRLAEMGPTMPPGAVRQARTADHRAALESRGGAAPSPVSNARVEQVNTQIRLIIRRGFGYHSPQAVIALAMLALGGLCPPLPGR